MKENSRIPFYKTLHALPTEWQEDPLPAIKCSLEDLPKKIVVLDDDPIGTQTVRGVAVLTEYSVERLTEEFSCAAPAFFILTNTRSMSAAEAYSTAWTISNNLTKASIVADMDFLIVIRSDSTLRGHFYEEIQAVRDGSGKDFDGCIFAPFFLEGGRFTIEDNHYVREGEWLTPASDTEFAADSSFPFSSSHIPTYIEGKTRSEISATSVNMISLSHLRLEGPEKVTKILSSLSGNDICGVNATAMRDMEVLAQAYLAATKKRILVRASASFIRALLGQSESQILGAEVLTNDNKIGGLLVIGSHVPRSTSQLQHLLENNHHVVPVEIDVPKLLDQKETHYELSRVRLLLTEILVSGSDAVLFTTRNLISGDSHSSNLEIGVKISSSLSELIGSLSVRPNFLVLKGGNTASRIALYGLNIKRAWAIGQAAPGVPTWQLGQEAKFPNLSLIIFPGNVGHVDALTTLITSLQDHIRKA